MSLDLPADWELYSKVRLRYDIADKLEPGQPDQSTRSPANRRFLFDDGGELELRELYLQGQWADVDWTLGKQAVTWGKADDLPILNIVTPRSYREFIVEDREDALIPLWGIRAERTYGTTTIEGILQIDNTHHELVGAGALFEVTSSRFNPINTNIIESIITPIEENTDLGEFADFFVFEAVHRGPLDVEFGGRVTTFWNGWDLGFVAFRHAEDAPTVDLDISGRNLIVRPVYDRVNLYGASFANAFGDMTFRGEVGYTGSRRYYPRIDLLFDGVLPDLIQEAINNETVSDNLSYVLAVDWFGFKDTLISAQFLHDMIIRDFDGLARPRNDYLATLLLRRSFLNDELILEAEGVANLVDGDSLVTPRIIWAPAEATSFYIEADIFSGDPDGIFGQFNENSRVEMGASYQF